MRWIKNQRSGEYLFDGPIEWNMWQRKLAPFGELSTGDTVFLMRDAETFTEEVLVGDVLATEYQSKPHAWDLLTAQFPVLTTDPGISLDAFLRHTYTSGREDSGVISAWSYRSVRPLSLLRPVTMPDLKRSGWLSLEGISDDRLRRWGLIGNNAQQLPPAHGGRRAPRQPTGKKLKAVESRAMDVALDYLLSLGRWRADEIHDTSASESYDFECSNGTDVVRVEVKGLSGGLGPVNLTVNEMNHARSGETPMMLIVVYGIEITAVEGDFVGGNGAIKVWDPWEIGDGTLRASQYDYWAPSVPVPPNL